MPGSLNDLVDVAVKAPFIHAAPERLSYRMQQAQPYYGLPTFFVSLTNIGVLDLVTDRLRTSAHRVTVAPITPKNSLTNVSRCTVPVADRAQVNQVRAEAPADRPGGAPPARQHAIDWSN